MASVADVVGFGSNHHYDYNHRYSNDVEPVHSVTHVSGSDRE